MNRVTVGLVNQELRKQGIQARLVPGEGYFYFVGDAIDLSKPGVYVYKVWELSIEEWVEEARDRITNPTQVEDWDNNEWITARPFVKKMVTQMATSKQAIAGNAHSVVIKSKKLGVQFELHYKAAFVSKSIDKEVLLLVKHPNNNIKAKFYSTPEDLYKEFGLRFNANSVKDVKTVDHVVAEMLNDPLL